MQHLNELKTVESDNLLEKQDFENTIESIDRLVNKLDSMSNTLMKADEHAFFGMIVNLFK
jgi:uncharacterized protein (UPF0305 family)